MSETLMDGCFRGPQSRACFAMILLAGVLASASSSAEGVTTSDAPPVYRPLSPEEIAAAERVQGDITHATGAEPVAVPSFQAQPQAYGPVYGAGLPPLPEPAPKPEVSEDRLAMARQAYWRQEYALAESLYQDLMEERPRDPNPAGELGNIYFAQGRWQQAAGAYRVAALNLAGLRRFGQAMHMTTIVGGLDPQVAHALAQEIDSIRRSRP